jgi:hypothetical protein
MSNKHPNLVIRDDGIMIVKNVRLSYEHIFDAWAKEEGKPKKFSATGLLDKDTHSAEIAKLQEILTARQKEVFKKRLPADKLCLRDGDLTGKDGYENQMYLATSEKIRPTVLDKDGKTPVAASDDRIYSGCYVNIMFRLWDQNNQHGQRINANLLGVQFMRDGEKFSTVNRPAADEMFDNEGGEDDGFED